MYIWQVNRVGHMPSSAIARCTTSSTCKSDSVRLVTPQGARECPQAETPLNGAGLPDVAALMC